MSEAEAAGSVPERNARAYRPRNKRVIYEVRRAVFGSDDLWHQLQAGWEPFAADGLVLYLRRTVEH